MAVYFRGGRGTLCACLTFAAVLFGGCGEDRAGKKPGRAVGGPRENIVVGINTTLKNTPVILAKKNGFFQHNGLQVETVSFQTGVEILNALFAGTVDVGAVPEHLAAFSSMNRSDFRILAVINRNRSNELVARRDRGIEAVGDLRGKRIGLKQQSSSIYWLYRLLISNSLAMDDVVLVDEKPAALVNMITRGDVDAVVTWHPYAFQGRTALGENAMVVDAQQGQDMFWLLLAREDFTEKGEKTEKLLRALREAEDYIEGHPDEARDTVAAYMRMDPDYADFEWPLHTFRLELPQNLVLAMEQEYRWKAGQEGRSDHAPNYLDFIYFPGLSAVKPEAVSIIHERR